MNLNNILIAAWLVLIPGTLACHAQEQVRARDLGIRPGILSPGPWNAITDVPGVMVGHRTLIEGDSVRTGVTVVLPHTGNLFMEKVPAAICVGNGFGKAVGFTQVEELGNLETPIGLTNTLSVFTVANGLVEDVLARPGNEEVRSVNPVAGETNDGWLNDIRGRHVNISHVREAIASAASGPVAEGCVGAGTGTVCMGYKGGIGTSSRVLPEELGGFAVGVLVQSNFGGILTINGAPVGEELGKHYLSGMLPEQVDGSCMIVIATDAPVDARNLERMARRSFLAFGTVGGFSSNGSGDYAIAFSTHPELRIPHNSNATVENIPLLRNEHMTPLFLAVVEATAEAIYNSLFMATRMEGLSGRVVEALPLGKTLEILDHYHARH